MKRIINSLLIAELVLSLAFLFNALIALTVGCLISWCAFLFGLLPWFEQSIPLLELCIWTLLGVAIFPGVMSMIDLCCKKTTGYFFFEGHGKNMYTRLILGGTSIIVALLYFASINYAADIAAMLALVAMTIPVFIPTALITHLVTNTNSEVLLYFVLPLLCALHLLYLNREHNFR